MSEGQHTAEPRTVLGVEIRRPTTRQIVVLVVFGTLFLAVLALVTIFGLDFVDGSSMEPTLVAGDRVITLRRYLEPRKGDIIVFDRVEKGRRVRYIKRVVAVPGDLVELYGSELRVNGVKDPLSSRMRFRTPPGGVRMGAGELFVSGDNRDVSIDSRFFGPVKLPEVAGRVVAICSPTNRVCLLGRPAKVPEARP